MPRRIETMGPSSPGRHNVHPAVRLKFVYAANIELKQIGTSLEILGNLRSHASYDLRSLPDFTSSLDARNAILEAAAKIALLDGIEADPVRRAGAIAPLPP